MNTLVYYAISLAVLGTCLADDEKVNRREKIVSFYKCLACENATQVIPDEKCISAGDEAIAAYEKCEQFKTEKGMAHLEECLKKVLPEEALTKSKRWNHYCENPASIGKTLDCLATEDYIKSLTEEDISSFKKFKDCVKGIKEQYCKHD